MSEKQEIKKRGRPPKIIPGVPADLDSLGKAIFAPVRLKRDQARQQTNKKG